MDELELRMISETIEVEQNFNPKNQAGLMLECQQFVAPYAKARQQPSPPDIVTTVTHTMTRTQAIEVVEPLVQRINEEPWQPDLNDELASKLTEETVAVLPPSTKVWLNTWAKQSVKPIVLERLEKFAEDKSTHEWTETRRIPGPARWSFTSPALTLLDDWFYLAEHADLNDKMARRQMKATIAALQHYFRKMEERYELKAKAEAMDKINALQDTIVDMKEAMQQSQTDFMAAMKEMQQSQTDAIAAMKEAMQQSQEARTDTTNKINALQDTMVAMQQEMQKLQLSIQNGVGKRTHEEAFGNPCSD